MRKSTGDSADPRSTGVFKAARISDGPQETPTKGGCSGCFVGPVRLSALAAMVTLFSLSPLTALIVVGWSLQFARRIARWRYWRLQPVEYRGDGFLAYAKTRHWRVPPWVPPLMNDWYPQKAVAPRWFGGGWRNFRVGATCWLHSTVWWLPVIVLWMGARRRGWRGGMPNEAELGTPVFVGSVAVVVLLAAVMRVLPLLQARYAYTRDWRVFYDWQTILRFNYLDPVGGTWLAVLYGLAAHLLHLAAGMTRDVAGWYYWFAWLIVLFVATLLWTFLRLAAVWIYPRVLREALANEVLELKALHPTEQELIQTLSWSQTPARRGIILRLLGLSAPLVQLFFWILTGLLMTTGMQQTRPASGTMVQHPLIHVPWVAPAAPDDQTDDL